MTAVFHIVLIGGTQSGSLDLRDVWDTFRVKQSFIVLNHPRSPQRLFKALIHHLLLLMIRCCPDRRKVIDRLPDVSSRSRRTNLTTMVTSIGKLSARACVTFLVENSATVLLLLLLELLSLDQVSWAGHLAADVIYVLRHRHPLPKLEVDLVPLSWTHLCHPRILQHFCHLSPLLLKLSWNNCWRAAIYVVFVHRLGKLHFSSVLRQSLSRELCASTWEVEIRVYGYIQGQVRMHDNSALVFVLNAHRAPL